MIAKCLIVKIPMLVNFEEKAKEIVPNKTV